MDTEKNPPSQFIDFYLFTNFTNPFNETTITIRLNSSPVGANFSVWLFPTPSSRKVSETSKPSCCPINVNSIAGVSEERMAFYYGDRLELMRRPHRLTHALTWSC